MQGMQHPADRLLANARWSIYSRCATQAIDAPRHAAACFWYTMAWLSRGISLEGLRHGLGGGCCCCDGARTEIRPFAGAGFPLTKEGGGDECQSQLTSPQFVECWY